MVCMRQTTKNNTKQTKTNRTSDTAKNGDYNSNAEMDFEEEDRLQLQHLAGGDLVAHPPLYAPNGEYLFILKDKVIEVFSTSTGEQTRQLLGSTSKLISMELELKDNHTLVGCTEKGEVLRWQWRSGSLDKKLTLNLPAGEEVRTFNLLNMYGNSETACAFVVVKYANDEEEPQKWFIVNTTTGNKLEVALNLKLKTEDPLVAVESKNFNFIAIAQGSVLHIVNCKTWKHSKQKNANKVPITVVRAHPTEDVIATGDDVGKVFLWRQVLGQKRPLTCLYHWHHTSITSLAFSSSGSSFYSSGLEGVLVRWNVQNPKLRNFIPRMCAIIRHIVVSEGNTQVAVCTADNGVQIVGTDNQLKSTLQEFTYVLDDKTGKSKFPVGLRLNPRTNTLVLNGRIGHLQFYSAYTRNLLYNMDIVVQNRLSMETDKILYNIRVTKAAFNIDWMATGEVFNDEEHLPELRLKFWKYEEKTQSYSLNTNIELPHEGGFKAIEFSNEYQVDNLLCATVGEDNTVKMWSLEESDNIYKKGKVWYCIAQTSYKQMPIESICFSQDGSLLATGFGNTLCIYKADNLKLKAALTGSVGFDGCVQKAQVRIAKQQVNGAKNEIAEQRKKIMLLFSNLLDSNDETLIKEIRKSLHSKNKQAPPEPLKPLDEINEKQKTALYSGILQMHELNLFQKVLLYQKLGISCQVHPQLQTKMATYLNETVTKSALKGKSAKLHKQLPHLNVRDRFKAKYRLHQYTKRQRNYDAEITQNLVPILSVLNLSENSTQPQLTKSPKVKVNGLGRKSTLKSTPVKKIATDNVVPQTQQTVAEISRVQFAAGEHAHLVVVCTETRVLVWNLLTLRLQSVFKLSVQHLAFDAQTNLLAAFTKNNELHVFQPNVPLPLYQRRNLPKLFGAVWLPRRQPIQRSLNLDWQAQSILYFLTEKQEIMYLGSPKDVSSFAPAPITFTNNAVDEGLRYSTFGTFATQKSSDKELAALRHSGPLILSNSGKSAVKALIDMSTHTMPPLSLLCGDFVKSLVKPAESSTPSNGKSTYSSSMRTNGGYDEEGDVRMNGNASHSESDNEGDDDVSRTIKARKSILAKNEELSQNDRKTHKTTARHLDPNSEEALKRIVGLTLDFNYNFTKKAKSFFN